MCTNNVVEDEVHFLIDCDKYVHTRGKYKLLVMQYLNSSNNFINVMTATDFVDLSNLAGFLEEAMCMRENANV